MILVRFAPILGAWWQSLRPRCQSTPITGTTQQQNLAETALEDAAHRLARALRLLLLAQGNQADAEAWNPTLTDWRKLQEQALLNRAKALQTALNDLIGDYEGVIGAPVAARAGRKAKTAEPRPPFRAVDGILEGMDDLILQFRSTAADDLFVAGCFNARRLGGNGSVTPPAPPTPPPTPNP